MNIHITKKGEKLTDIAEKYSVSEENIKNTNELYELSPADGEELLILQPTRTYKVQFGDTPERIALRFGIGKNDIFLNNPQVIGRQLIQGEELTLKQGERKHGMAVANGYYYKDCNENRLFQLLPYLTYVTFASTVADERGIKRIFDDHRLVEKVSKEKKIPLIRVYDKYLSRYDLCKDISEFAKELIELAISGGYKGIVLNSSTFNNSAEKYSSFLIDLRKIMIGCDLILITEISPESPMEFCEYADGAVMYYPKYAENEPLSFDEGERKIFADFACLGESAKAFIDLPCLGSVSGGYVGISDALSRARRNGCEITHNESTLLSHYRDRKQGEVVFPSMQSIKEIFEIINEFDYMGICFDIMRVPMYQILMYNALFKTSYMNSVRTREGCSRAVEE